MAFAISSMTPALASAQNEIDCGYPITQSEMNFCAQKGWVESDARLNSVYTDAIATMREIDSDLPETMKGAVKALRDAQRAWISFRDRACEAYGFLARGGSMEPTLVYGCMATLTVKRIEELKEFTGSIDE